MHKCTIPLRKQPALQKQEFGKSKHLPEGDWEVQSKATYSTPQKERKFILIILMKIRDWEVQSHI